MRFGRYDLVERIGQGGMAEVWKAKLLGPGGFARELAVKRILPTADSDPGASALFLREARVLARLRHRAVVQVFELDEVDGRPYLAMEYIDGLSLFQLIRQLPRDRDLDAGLCALIVQEVCYALAYLHTLADDDGNPLGLLHRDVSPHNVMISVDGAVKLLDFGVAKPASTREALTTSGIIRGKLGYMSWEHIEGLSKGAGEQRADIYSAGVVLWELLTARRLFKDRSDFAGLRDQRLAPIVPPSQLRAGVPPELDAICLRALAFDRAERYRDANEMADALASIAKQLGARTDGLVALVTKCRGARLIPLPDDPGTIATSRPLRWPWLLAGLVAISSGVLFGLHWRPKHSAPKLPPVAPRSIDPPANIDPPAPLAPTVEPTPVASTQLPQLDPTPKVPKPTKRKRSHPLRNLKHGQIVDPFHPGR